MRSLRYLLLVFFLLTSLLGNNNTFELKKEFIKESLKLQKQRLEVEVLYTQAKKALQKRKYREATRLMIQVLSKVELMKLPKNEELAKIREFKEFTARVYIEYSEELFSSNDSSLNNLSYILENLQKAYDLTSLYHKKIKYISSKVFKKRSKIVKKTVVGLDKIINLEDALNSKSKGVIRRQYLSQIRFQRGKVYFDERDYENAISEFEALLILDPYNEKARSYLERCFLKLNQHAQARRKLTIAQLKAVSVWKWSKQLKARDIFKVTRNNKVVEKSVSSNVTKLKDKLDIKINSFQITNTKLKDVLIRLRALTRKQDPEGVGISFVVRDLDGSVGGEETSKEDDEDSLFGEEKQEIDNVSNDYLKIEEREISIDLKNIPVREILNYIASVAKLKYKVEAFAVLITDRNDPGDNLSTDFFPASATFLEVIEESSGEGEEEDEEDNSAKIKKYFESLGVTFPPKSQIRYISAVNRLVVTNTQENLRRVEELLTQLNIAPKQILIEAKFIDVAQDDLDEVGFQWFFEARSGDADASDTPTQDYLELTSGRRSRSIGLRESGIGDPTGIGAIQRNATNLASVPFANIPTGEQLRVTTFLDRVRYDTLIRLLDQKDSLDILSAPKVSTTNGSTATLRIVDERYFPESWEPPEVTVNSTTSIITPPVPQFSPPRDIGVGLEVTPQIDADGYSIKLQTLAQVVEFLGYDDSFNDTTVISGETLDLRYDVPIISVRRIETNILLYDGESVVLGGLIREQITGIEDRVPLISSVPLVGRLFTSKAVVSQKRNFLIFVSVRLISPSGVAIRPNKIRGLPDFKKL